MPPRRQRPEDVGLPPRPFLYTVDQISVLVELSIETLFATHLYLEGRTVGRRNDNLMQAYNIAPEDERPDWRVSETELIRWMKRKGFRFYERGWVT